MEKYIQPFLKILACYCIAGAVLVLYLRWPHYEGHPHVPLSGFPEFLLLSPLAPVLLVSDPSIDGDGEFLSSVVLFILVFLVLLFLRFRGFKPKEKRKNA